ncbi:hypothetical protein [Nocardia altamirensis]|uniref:hypothetical protein n=1 Tax=Nocardia altamirensis TaxID=472158 RepID=UPI000840852C|nr:hypothetical protein [Nocardia altamirensis]
MSTVRRFWIEFDLANGSFSWPLLPPGVGVTGFDERDCLSMVADLLPYDTELPPVRRITVDISLAEKLPVNPPTLGVPVWRGVWYPPSNLRTGPTWRPRGVDRNPAAPAFGPKPRTDSPTQPGASMRPDPLPLWWDEIPYVDSLLWPVGNMPYAHLGDQMWRYAPELRAAITKEPSYGDMVREALDYVIARRPAPDNWFDPTTTTFLDQQQQDQYLRAFRAYLFGHHPDPIYPPRTPTAPGRLLSGN